MCPDRAVPSRYGIQDAADTMGNIVLDEKPDEKDCEKNADEGVSQVKPCPPFGSDLPCQKLMCIMYSILEQDSCKPAQ